MAELLDTLCADPQLARLGEDDLAALAGALEVEDAPAGTVLAAAGEPTEALMLLLEGEVAITGLGPEQRARPGSWLGGISGIDFGAGLATATALGDVRLARLPRANFRKIHAERAAVRVALGLSFGAQLARRFRAIAGEVRQRVGGAAVGAETRTLDYDVVVIGAGPHGLAYAGWVKQDRPEARVAVVDKRHSPGFKIGESTLGPVIRAGLSLGVEIPVWRRLFNNKLGLHFWWMGEDDADLHRHFDQVIEETFQLERRVFETLMMKVVERLGVDVYQDTKALLGDSRVHGQPKELVCQTAGGDTLRLRSKVLCDASGPAAALGRHLGIRRKATDFNCNAYFGYFLKRADAGFPSSASWNVPATRHLCFPEGWVWFIELASWERASDERLSAMVDHLLDIGGADESAYPTRYELAERFECPLDQWPVSIGVVPRTDIDTAAELPFEERFNHYVGRYPALKRAMDAHDLVEAPYEGHPTFISYTDLVQYSDRYAGDGWLLVGDAAYFVNPLFSPGMTYGHSVASFAARETVNALDRGDFSAEAFAGHDAATAKMYEALVTDCELLYRSFAHPDAYDEAFRFRILFNIGLRHERVLQFGGLKALQIMRPMRPPGPPAEILTNPRYLQLSRQAIDAARAADGPEDVARAMREILGPVNDELRLQDGVRKLRLGEAFKNFDDEFNRVAPKEDGWDYLVGTWLCARCENNNPTPFERCVVCGDPPR